MLSVPEVESFFFLCLRFGVALLALNLLEACTASPGSESENSLKGLSRGNAAPRVDWNRWAYLLDLDSWYFHLGLEVQERNDTFRDPVKCYRGIALGLPEIEASSCGEGRELQGEVYYAFSFDEATAAQAAYIQCLKSRNALDFRRAEAEAQGWFDSDKGFHVPEASWNDIFRVGGSECTSIAVYTEEGKEWLRRLSLLQVEPYRSCQAQAQHAPPSWMRRWFGDTRGLLESESLMLRTDEGQVLSVPNSR